MWQHTLNPDGTAYKEVTAYLTNFGVVVLPNANADHQRASFQYWHNGRKTYYKLDDQVLNIYALVHTHPNGYHDSLTDPTDYDFTYARGLPDFVIGKNGTVQMGVANPFTGNISLQIGTTDNLFNGTLSLYKYIAQ